ncbi:MAG: hypothetical protein ABH844_06550 [Candidatus Omnitrophota bacterium]
MKNIQQYLQNIENRKGILADAADIYEKAGNEKTAFFYSKHGDLVLTMNTEEKGEDFEKPTLFIA